MRRLFQHRASAVVALGVILTTLLGLIGAGEFSWRDHDSLVRHGRGSSQRLRTDAVSHDEESPDLLVAPVHSSLIAPDSSLGIVARTSVHAPPGPAVIPTRAPHVGPDLDFILLTYAEPSAPVATRSFRPFLGRAPPLA
jgi:hypothetical protein